MRFATLRTNDGPRAALRQDDHYVNLHATDASIPASLREILAQGSEMIQRVQTAAKFPDAVRVSLEEANFHAPIHDPIKIVCVGLNYRDHAEESGAKIPQEPILFSKYPSSLIGHEESIVLPSVSDEVDYEAELVIVIGKSGRFISKESAMDYVAGYAVGHDVSARDWQLKKDGKQWMVGKTFDTFAPIGPELVTTDEVPDPHKLRIQLRLNGETMQDSNTDQMIFSVSDVVSYLSQIFTLDVGDLIFTGTPPGVGFARKPPIFLKDGDVAEVEIEGLGVLRNPAKS